MFTEKRPLSWYKKKLDQVFSQYIRARDQHICFTCSKSMESKNSQCGHFVPRQYLSVRYDERNCHAQCYACNLLYNGQPSAYAARLTRDYGSGIIEELEERRHTPVKLNADWYVSMIEVYREKAKKQT